MLIKKFLIGNSVRTFQCTTKCPEDVGIEMQEVVNHALKKGNELISFAYNANKKDYPNITRPTLYVYVREDSLDDINAFTDGKDIYLSVLATCGMESYISERLKTNRINGDELVPDWLENTTHIKLYDRILELIVAHELMHIWHGHQQWKYHTLHYISKANNLDEVLHEKIDFADPPAISINDIIDSLIINYGGVICQSVYDKNYIQQILELDSDRGAITIVMQKLHKELQPFLTEFNKKETTANRKAAILKTHGYELGITIGAAALMLGFFDQRHKISSFDSLNYLLVSEHPIPAIRFFEMDKVFLNMIGSMYTNDNIPHWLINETNAFVYDILAHNAGEMHIGNCFWMPALTFEAQNFTVLLMRGWNRIRNSLQTFAQVSIREQYEKEYLEVFPEWVKFDINGNYIHKE